MSTAKSSSSKPKHPNRIPFVGVLTRLDSPSDKPPEGARGHRVILTRRAAEEAIPTLLGMAIAFKANWDGHDPRQKCGIITEAYVEGDELCVAGHLFGHDFPEVAVQVSKPGVKLGMSYEMVDVHIADMRQTLWSITRLTFTGAAILLCSEAAYKRTRFSLQASQEVEFSGRLKFVSTTGKASIGCRRNRKDKPPEDKE